MTRVPSAARRSVTGRAANSRHLMGPEHLRLVRWATDAQISNDGEKVAWCETSFDLDKDEAVSSIMVSTTKQPAAPRRFTEGPHDSGPRWSPDGRYLAYLSASGAPPALHLAPLDGGTPLKVPSPGPVRGAEWSPTGGQLVLVAHIGDRDDGDDPRKHNQARVVRGLFNRFDGAGWLEGRDHLFIYDLSTGALRQLTSGDYDHAQPGWSPDGARLAFVSDRSGRRNDDPGRGDIWVVAIAGGRPRRLVSHVLDAQAPVFSPDGQRVAFTGIIGPGRRPVRSGRDTRIFVVGADGGTQPEKLVPALDRPVGFALSGASLAWLSADELVFTVADQGTIGVRRARLGDGAGAALLEGDQQVGGLSLGGAHGRRVLAYTSAWVDSPSEAYVLDLLRRRRRPAQVSRAGEDLAAAVELLGTERLKAKAPDGEDVEYFVVRPKAAPGRRARSAPPLFLEVHGGPNFYNPIAEIFHWYQGLAAAGYLVCLPNPRGSIGYGESFTARSKGDWGGADMGDDLACADDVIERGLADPRRQFIGGYSYGGFTSALAVGRTHRFRAASVGAPVIDLASQFGTWDGAALFAEVMGGDPWHLREEYSSRSPLTFVPDVQTPVFLYVNDGDLRCPPGQADQFYAGLKYFGNEVEYVRYPGGCHFSLFPTATIPSQAEDRLRRVLHFLSRHGGTRVPAGQAVGSW